MSDTIKATVTGLKRLDNSKDGNPAWLIDTDQGSWRTAKDSQSGLDAGNLEVGDVVELLIEQADGAMLGRITRVTKVDA